MKAKKSLGQNFFINENLGEKIVKTTLETNPKTIIEIGPGRGFFTKKLSNSGKKIIVIEKDNVLAQYLEDEYPDITVINKDFLDLDLKNLNLDNECVFFGSLPYNVSKPIIRKILESEISKNPSYFIIQKEVAEKYTAKEPENNQLSLQTQLYASSKKLFDISKGSFRPVPKVTSSFIKFTPLDKKIDIKDIKSFNKFLNVCFTSPRKTLRNNLKSLLKEKDINTDLLNKRPQQLSLNDFINLFTFLK